MTIGVDRLYLSLTLGWSVEAEWTVYKSPILLACVFRLVVIST